VDTVRNLLAVALLLVPISAYAAAPPKACALLTQQQAAAIFGAPVKPPLDANLACIFDPVAPAHDTGVNINLVAMEGAPPGTMAKAYEGTLHKDYATDTIESVPGLGEQNRVIVSTHKITINVLHHEGILSLIVTNSTNPHLKPDMIQALKLALTKF
jgi:hypothetical protein